MAWECQPEHLPGGGLLDVSLEFFFQRSLARVLGNSVVDSFRACHMASRAVILIWRPRSCVVQLGHAG